MSIFSKILEKLLPHKASASQSAAQQPGQVQNREIDISAILNDLAGKKNEKLNWKVSIVDLMKVLDLDSSFGSRKQLAQEFHYSGDTNDSASMNIWLHRQVMKKLAENGGKLPDDLKSHAA